ncbi:MAG: hypothetical protein MUF49_11400 [Oculatellaceae cyanobacterium Prado106]|nr:hypothetical protein [Oculatellaceae cyanobacterium Prado106]
MTQENPEHRLSTGEYHPWRIMILLSNAQNECIATFRNRPDAEHYLRSIRRLAPQYHYELVFHPPELEEVQE